MKSEKVRRWRKRTASGEQRTVCPRWKSFT